MSNFYLFFNLSFSKCSFKLLDENFDEISIKKFEVQKNLINIVNDVLDDFMKENNVTFQDIERIYFCNGPGNFTGIRVTNSIVKTISLVHQHIKFYAINNLHWMCMGNGLSFLTANSVLYYCCAYRNNERMMFMDLIGKNEKDQYINRFEELKVFIDDFSDVVTDKQIWSAFKLVDDVISLEPFYIKEPI